MSKSNLISILLSSILISIMLNWNIAFNSSTAVTNLATASTVNIFFCSINYNYLLYTKHNLSFCTLSIELTCNNLISSFFLLIVTEKLTQIFPFVLTMFSYLHLLNLLVSEALLIHVIIESMTTSSLSSTSDFLAVLGAIASNLLWALVSNPYRLTYD